MASRIRYARNGDVSLAYRVLGDGERDIVLTIGWVASMEAWATEPEQERFVNRLARLGRVILWDKRGTGLSDRVSPERLPTLEERMDDVRAVMDAAGSERAVLFGISEGVALSVLFAASHPERTEALLLYGGTARFAGDEGYPWMPEPERFRELAANLSSSWGDNAWALKLWAPSIADDPIAQAAWNEALVQGASPAAAEAWLRMAVETDVTGALSAVGAPTLVLHREGDQVLPAGNARFVAERIPGAQLVLLPGRDHLWWVPNAGMDVLDEVESFLTGAPARRDPDRVLATVMFTDIVESTRRAAELGDRRWRDLVGRHDQVVRERLERFRGKEVKALGDGFLATFDGPGRAIRCAASIRDEIGRLGIPVRAGLHTGECELLDGDIGGIAVHIGARVGGKAGPGDVLVSQTVKDLVAGSGFEFEARGEHELRGVPGSWRLYAVGSSAA